MSRRKKAKVAHSTSHHYPPLAMSPVVSFDKQSTQPLLTFNSPLPRPVSAATTSPASVPTRTSSHSNLLPLRFVASDSPLSSPSVSLQSAPLPSPGALVAHVRPVDLHNDPYLLADDELPDVDALIAQAHAKHSTPSQPPHSLLHVDEVPATPTPPNPTPQPPTTPAPPIRRTLSYLLADPSPPLPPPPPPQHTSQPTAPPSPAAEPARGLSVVPSSVEAGEAVEGVAGEVVDDWPSLSQLMNEEEEEWRRQVVEEEYVASLDELLHQSDDDDTSPPPHRSTSEPTQQSTQTTQPTQVLPSAQGRGGEDEDEEEASDVDEMAATQVLPPRSWAEESQSQSQRPTDEEQLDRESGVAGVNVSVSCGVSEWQSSPAGSVDGDVRLPRPHLLHTGRILLSNSSSLSFTPG